MARVGHQLNLGRSGNLLLLLLLLRDSNKLQFATSCFQLRDQFLTRRVARPWFRPEAQLLWELLVSMARLATD